VNDLARPEFPPRRRKRRPDRRGGTAVACVIAVVVSASIIGCAPLLDAQSALVTQARRGIELAASNRATCDPVHAELARVRRQRLDDAFDADVRERDRDGALTADWVIAHRAAYAAALSAYARQESDLAASDATARRNLQAVDGALERLQYLQSIQNRWQQLSRTPEDDR
jgi:hypothetical protein